MTAADASPDHDVLATLHELYPGRWASLLVELCSPTRAHAHGEGPCTTNRGKRPLAKGWHTQAVERWRAGAPTDSKLSPLAAHLARGGNLGLALPPGVVALDADTPEAAAWLETALPDAPVQATARGAHFLVRVEHAVAATTGLEILPGIRVDVRAGERSQIVVEPSTHASGAAYTWKRNLPEHLEQIPVCPPLIAAALHPAEKPPAAGEYEAGAWDGTLPARVAELLARDERLRARWEGNVDRLHDRSDSGIDLAVATRLALAGVPGGEIEAALRYRRHEAGAKPKASDYYTRTVRVALAAAREHAREDPPPPGDHDVPPPEADTSSAGARHDGGNGAAPPEAASVAAARFFDASGFIPQRMGQTLKAESYFSLGEDFGLYRYEGGVYRPDGEAHARARIRDLLAERFKRRHLDDTLAWLKAETATIPAAPPERVLNVANGLLDWRTGELRPHTPEHRSAIQLPVAWNPDAECPAIDDFLADVLPDEATVRLVLEIVGYALLAGLPYHVAVLLLGPGRNGKSVLLAIIRALLGAANVASVPLQLFSESRFASAALFGKLANICGDLDARAIERTDLFKMLTGGDALHVERKYGQPFEFVSFALPIFSANEAPHSRDQSDAWFERWLVVPMPKVIPPEKRDPRLAQKLTTRPELEGLLVRAVEGLHALTVRGRFDAPDPVRAASREYREELDSVAGWLAESCDTRDPQAVTPRSVLYASYRRWCEATGHRYPLRAAAVYARLRLHPVLREHVREGVRGFRGVRLVE